jgi:NhaA family Na+:H+ antiporter
MDGTMKRKVSTPATPVQRLLLPFQQFLRQEASGGLLLLACTVLALAWANSPFASSYTALWQTHVTVGLGGFILDKPLLLWINDGLMAVFFFVVGLEIKREVLGGELASLKQAALPLVAAVGGMVVPALCYVAFNLDGPGAAGWGIPMATDIAFALGVLALLGKRAPLSLKIFLTALAIVDDIGAVLVIALFYTAELSWLSLAVGTGFLAALIAVNRLGVRHPLVYLALGLGLWTAFLKSGVHATVAGVLLAMTIPSRAGLGGRQFSTAGRELMSEFDQGAGPGPGLSDRQQAAVQALEAASQQAESPLQRLEHTLHPWVAFAIMPVFALANAGVGLGREMAAAVVHPISLGILAGLVLGKQLGILGFVWVAVKTRLVELPAGIGWRQIHGVGCLAGIGFTMSLFIAGLAFAEEQFLTVAKMGILAASLVSGVVGWLLLRGASSARGS